MRIFIFLALYISCLSYVNAAESSREPDPARVIPITPLTPADSRRVPVEEATSRPNQHHTPEPIFTDLPKRCIRPGDILNIKGQHLSILDTKNLVLKMNGDKIILKRLGISDTQLITQLPSDPRLQANHNYPLFLVNQSDFSSYQQTNLSLRICSFLGDSHSEVAISNNHEQGQVLILIDTFLSNSLQQEMVKLGYQVLQQHLLAGIDKVMLTISVNDQIINDVIADLQRKFPKALIDLNNHYQPTAGPRTYAADMVAWSKVTPCHRDRYKKLSIGLIDGYVDQSHPALIRQSITVKNFLKESEQPEQQHGTAIAVILTGDEPNLGFQGLLPDANIIAASILRKEENNLIATTEGIVQSIDWLITQDVRLVNVSLSGTKANLILRHVFELALSNGLIIFSAAGNNGEAASESYPAALSGVIAITAIDAAKRVYRQANQGDYIDFAAPGVDLWISNNDNQGKYSSGTSYAVPYALAVAALYLTQNKSLSRDIVYSAMRANSEDLGNVGHDSVFGWGLVQAQQATCR